MKIIIAMLIIILAGLVILIGSYFGERAAARRGQVLNKPVTLVGRLVEWLKQR